jgi:GGDEF domain-containing protein
MNLKPFPASGKEDLTSRPEVRGSERCLTHLAEGAALNMPVIDDLVYHTFREAIATMARQLPDRLSDSDALPVIKSILKEFENYRKGVDASLRERQAAWRTLAGNLLRDLLGTLGIDPASTSAAPLLNRIAALSTGEQIEAFRAHLEDYLRPGGGQIERGSALKTADRSEANDNAAGLRGGGAAQQNLKAILDRGVDGFVVLFRLSCLDVIGERFGIEAIHDSLMAIAAYLTQALRTDDAVFHWSDSSLLAILETPATEQILTAAMQRIANSNRDITIKIGGRNVMLRIPLTFELTPISRFRGPEDLLKLSRGPAVRR